MYCEITLLVWLCRLRSYTVCHSVQHTPLYKLSIDASVDLGRTVNRGSSASNLFVRRTSCPERNIGMCRTFRLSWTILLDMSFLTTFPAFDFTLSMLSGKYLPFIIDFFCLVLGIYSRHTLSAKQHSFLTKNFESGIF